MMNIIHLLTRTGYEDVDNPIERNHSNNNNNNHLPKHGCANSIKKPTLTLHKFLILLTFICVVTLAFKVMEVMRMKTNDCYSDADGTNPCDSNSNSEVGDDMFTVIIEGNSSQNQYESSTTTFPLYQDIWNIIQSMEESPSPTSIPVASPSPSIQVASPSPSIQVVTAALSTPFPKKYISVKSGSNDFNISSQHRTSSIRRSHLPFPKHQFGNQKMITFLRPPTISDLSEKTSISTMNVPP